MTDTDTITLPPFKGDAPINYHHIRESVALAFYCEGVDEETVKDAIRTVDDAVVQNEEQLHWESDSLVEQNP